MSAERLREAAREMRKRAGAAVDESDVGSQWTPGPALDPDNNGWWVAYDPEADFDSTIATTPYDYDGHVARHVAGWHPCVALMVADWLDVEADDDDPCDASTPAHCYLRRCSTHRALAVADAYLGAR